MGGVRSRAVRQFPGEAKITDPHVILKKPSVYLDARWNLVPWLCVHRPSGYGSTRGFPPDAGPRHIPPWHSHTASGPLHITHDVY